MKIGAYNWIYSTSSSEIFETKNDKSVFFVPKFSKVWIFALEVDDICALTQNCELKFINVWLKHRIMLHRMRKTQRFVEPNKKIEIFGFLWFFCKRKVFLEYFDICSERINKKCINSGAFFRIIFYFTLIILPNIGEITIFSSLWNFPIKIKIIGVHFPVNDRAGAPVMIFEIVNFIHRCYSNVVEIHFINFNLRIRGKIHGKMCHCSLYYRNAEKYVEKKHTHTQIVQCWKFDVHSIITLFFILSVARCSIMGGKKNFSETERNCMRRI